MRALGLWSDWAYSLSEVKMDWAPEVKRISQELLGNSRDQLNQDDEEDGENFEENANGDDEGHE